MQDLTQYISPQLPTVQSIIDLVEGRREGFHVAAKARVLHRDLTRYTLPSPPVLSDPSDCTVYLIAGKIDWNGSRDVHWSIDVELDGGLASQVNFDQIYLQFSVCYYDGLTPTGDPGTLLLDVPVGTFGCIVTDRDLKDGSIRYKITMYDRTWEVRDYGFQNAYTIPAGFNVVQAVETMLQMDYRTPSEGGRQPANTARTGGPQASIPTGPNGYCNAGIPIPNGWVRDSDGSILSPQGLFGYNPYANILIDQTTHFPIDPWTCERMKFPQLGGVDYLGYPDTAQSSSGLWYNTRLGTFHYPWYPSGFGQGAIDPFSRQPLPAGTTYHHPDPANPLTGKVGNFPPPLQTWPYDASGGGPYAQTGNGQLTTGAPTTTTTTVTGATTMTLNVNQTIGSRYGNGAVSVTVIPAGNYPLGPTPTSVPDPANAGYAIVTPGTGTAAIDSAAVSGYAWAAGTWTADLRMRALPYMSGTISVSGTLYEKTSQGTRIARGTFTAGASVSLSSTQYTNTVDLTCSGAVAAFSPAAGSVLEVALTLHCATDLVASVTSATGLVAVLQVALTYPAPQITTTTTTPGIKSGGNGSVVPTQSGTGVPWPDSNNPGLTPAGCDDVGPNFPASQIVATQDATTLPITVTYTRKNNKLAAMNDLLTTANFWPVRTSARGDIVLSPQPYYSYLVPNPEYSLVTKGDGILQAPVTQRLTDQSQWANRVLVYAEPNNAAPIVALETNNSAASSISIPNLGRDIMAVIQDDKIPDQATANFRAFVEINKRATAQDSVDLTCACLPFLEGHDAIDVEVTVNGERAIGIGEASTSVADAGGVAQGAVEVTLASGAGFSVGDSVQLGSGNTLEHKTINGLAGAVATLSSPTRFSHPMGEPVAKFSTPFLVTAWSLDLFKLTDMKVTAGKTVTN